MKAFRQKMVRWLIYAGVVLSLRFFRALPFPLGVRVGRFLGKTTYYILGRERRQALSNLSLAFGRQDGDSLKAVAKGMFENFGRGYVELTHIRRFTPRIADYVRIEGRDHVDRALEGGKGLLWITGHIGNWELLAITFARLGYPINVIARPVYDQRINDLIFGLRAENGVKTISRGDAMSVREIFRALRKNELVGLLIDQDTKVQGVFVEFFGRKAFTPRGAAEIALRADCPVVAGFIHRTDDSRHTITVSSPLVLRRTGDWERDVVDNTQLFTFLIEKEIRKNPSEWVWLHKRWHRRPSVI